MDQKSSKLINAFWGLCAIMLLCPHSVGLVHRGGGQTDRKLIWDSSRHWWTEEGRGRTEQERDRERVQGSSSVGPRQGPWVPPSVSCLHTEKFLPISQLSFQWPLKRDRFLPGYSPSIQWEWLLSWENPNLWHPQWVTSLRCAIASVQTAALRNACEIYVCVRFRVHCWD